MLKSIERAIRRRIKRNKDSLPQDFDDAAAQTVRLVRPYTMTSPERIFALVQAVRYIVRAGIPGAIVECGVWRGGSMMAAAHALQREGETQRALHLFDTYEGMTAPTAEDVSYRGKSAVEQFSTTKKVGSGSDWCYASLDDVQANLASTGYALQHIHFVKGKVEETIPSAAPSEIALLRLDTDWYESTKHELEHLYPRLSRGGVLIVDDYGYWKGSRKAVDEYFGERKLAVLLNRVDWTGRVAVKL